MAVQPSNLFGMSNDWAERYIPKRHQENRNAPKQRWGKPQVGGSPSTEARVDVSRKLRLRESQEKRRKLRTAAHLVARNVEEPSMVKGMKLRLTEHQKKRKSLQTEVRMARMAARKLEGLPGTSEATVKSVAGLRHNKLDAKKANVSRYLVRKKNKNSSRATPSKTPLAVPVTTPIETNNNVEEKKRVAFELTSPAAKKELAIDRVYITYSMKMTQIAMYLTQNSTLWSSKLMSYANIIPASVAEEMTSTVGKSKLLLDSKMPQFAHLLNLYLIREDAVKPVLVSDLQGWWDAFDVEFGKLKFSFSVLQQLQENNWQPLDSEEIESGNNINAIDAKKTKNKGITKAQSRKSSPAVLQFLAGKRQEMRQSRKLGQLHLEVIFVTSSSKDPSNPQPGPSKEDADTVVSTPPRSSSNMPLEIEIFSTPGGNLNESLLGRTTIIDSPGDTIHYSRLLRKKLQTKPRLSREGSRRASMAMLALGNALDQSSQKITPSDSNAEGNSPVEPETTLVSAVGDTFLRAQNRLKVLTSSLARSRWNPWK